MGRVFEEAYVNNPTNRRLHLPQSAASSGTALAQCVLRIQKHLLRIEIPYEETGESSLVKSPTTSERVSVLRNLDLRFRNLATRRSFLWLGGSVLLILILIFVAAFLLDEPLRRKMEADLNNRLKGYTVRVGRLDFHPVGLSLDLKELTIYQTAHPDPPIAHIPNLSASVHWKALLRGRLVADFELDNPTVRFDLTQFSQEARDETPIKEKGWQDAVQAIYPLKINRFVIRNADITYIDKGPFRPLRITQLNFIAENIRNVQSEEGTYPSPLEIEGVVFDTGKLRLKGHADFLAEPHIAFKGDFQVEKVALDYFRPITERYRFSVRKGVLSADGFIEYAPDTEKILIKRVTLDGLDTDYIHEATGAPPEGITKKVAKTARKYSNEPTLEVKVDQLGVRNSQFGFVNRAANPPYRVFFTEVTLEVQNFSNHLKDGVARGKAKAKFMGSGPTEIEFAFRPETKGPDFDLKVRIENTDMRTMNDLFRAYGKFDVVAGIFSLYSEIKVRQGKIEGYVKPLFRDINVYDERQDREKSVFRKLYEGLVGGIAGLLENRPREEVATETSISGDIESPQASTWETVLRLIQNSFFKAILPGFEREVSQRSGSQKRKPTT
jgi:hypothetical protein